jgi:hypothetical protein
MKKYNVLVPFFKISEGKNYEIGDVIDISKEEALLLIDNGKVEEIKSKK